MQPAASEPPGQQSKLPEVSVLLSIFRGAEFIQEQLDSLIAQEGVRIRLIFHMDEEDPPTEAKVREAFPDAHRIAVSPGQGLPRAFFELILAAPPTDFYAFCDQDDVWHPRKLATAVEALIKQPDSPVLWICRVQPFRGPTPKDFNGDPYPSYVPKPSFGNALVETIGPGCAMVWNKDLHEFLERGQVVEGALMHDSWVYLVAASTGLIIVEPSQLVLYRLHQGNAVGIQTALGHRIQRFFTNRMRSAPSIFTQAASALIVLGNDLDLQERKIAYRLIDGSITERLRLAMSNEIPRQRSSDKVILMVRLLMR